MDNQPLRHSVSVAGVIVDDHNRALLIQRRDNHRWEPPGGVLEPGETIHDGLRREVREETGLEIAPLELVGFRQVIVRDAEGRVERHFVILPFVARWIQGEISLNEELAEAHWLTSADLAGLKTTEGLGQIVAAAAERIAARR